MAKRKLGHEDDNCMSGYIHRTSEIKQSNTSNVRYFDGTLQSSEEDFIRFVSFSPDKHGAFQTAQSLKSPVKLTNVKVTPKYGKVEVCFSKMSNIETCRSLSFDMKSLPAEDRAPTMPVCDITAANTRCTINIKALGFLEETQTITTKHGQKHLRTAVVADATGMIKLPLWETNIAKLTTGQCFCITNLLSTSFAGEMRLKTTSDTSFISIPPLQNVTEDMTELDTTQEFKGTIISCRLVVVHKCVHCKKPLDVDGNQQLWKCNSCGQRQRILPQNQSKTLHVQIVNDNQQEKKFVIFTDVLNDYMIKNDLTKKSVSEIEEYVLLQPCITIKHEEKGDIALSMN